MATVRSIAARLVRLWLGSLRWRVELTASPGPVVYGVWHSDLVAAGAWLRGQPVTSLVSASRDGDFLVAALEGRAMDFARGSDSRRAVSGARALKRALESGRSVATTWDGPRGPAGSRKKGPAWLAASCGVPLRELRFRYGAHLRLSDWSRLRLPLPWTEIVVSEAP